MPELLPIDTSHQRAKLTAGDFELLNAHGAFAAYRKTELIDGDMHFVNAQSRPHGMVKMRLYDALKEALRTIGSPYVPVCEVTLALSLTDRPEPEILLTRQPDGEEFVPVDTVPLIVEVSDTTLNIDLGRKLRRYASAGVPGYWVADVNGRVIHRIWSPADRAYAHYNEVGFGELLTSATIAELWIETGDL